MFLWPKPYKWWKLLTSLKQLPVKFQSGEALSCRDEALLSIMSIKVSWVCQSSKLCDCLLDQVHFSGIDHQFWRPRCHFALPLSQGYNESSNLGRGSLKWKKIRHLCAPMRVGLAIDRGVRKARKCLGTNQEAIELLMEFLVCFEVLWIPWSLSQL